MSKPTRPRYEFGPFLLDATEQLLLRDGRPIALKPKLFDLLLILVENSGHVLDKNRLMSEVWPDTFVEESSLTVGIFALRKALGDGRHNHSYIETVPRRGYRFVANVTEASNGGVDSVAAKRARLSSNGEERFEADAGVRSLAVLPFKYIGAEAGDEYLGLGLADALITKLTNLRQIRVRPTSAVREYTRARDITVAGRELKVDALLDGSIQRARKRIRVTAQLVDGRDGATLWAENFDEKLADIFSLEDSLSDQVVRALSLKLTGEERKHLVKRHTESTEAFHAYLKGRYFWNKRTAEGFKKGIEYCEHAIALDPTYALAYAGLADCYQLLSAFKFRPPRELIPKAKAALLKALQLDDTLAEAHTSLAHLLRREWNWSVAEKEFKRAIELNPNYATAHHWYSTYLIMMARFDEALAEIKMAHELDPLSLAVNRSGGILFYLTRQYDRAIEQLLETVELEPNFGYTHFVLGLVYAAKGMYDEAIKQYRKTHQTLSGKGLEPTACLGYIYALSGRRGEAQKVLDQLRGLSDQGYELHYHTALIYLALGDKDQAFAWLEQAYNERDEELGLLKVDPMLDSLRADPRFVSLLERVGLGPSQG
ncbi:MAG TPA: winged helix-turn-helix domain-containing protein [Nitrososphaera sp.]|nr:winged helix-turn-helix domain-containing protein [Nitrososphaera sp.]